MELAPSYKKCEKKLKEIKDLRKKARLNPEEIEKVKKETYYLDIVNCLYKKALEVLPDDLQILILSFVDSKTRLAYLRITYTPHTINEKIKKISNTESAKRKLHSSLKYINPTLKASLNKEGNIYKSIGYYITETRSFNSMNHWRFFEIMTEIIMAAVKQHKKIYSIKMKQNDLRKREIEMIKFYLFILRLL